MDFGNLFGGGELEGELGGLLEEIANLTEEVTEPPNGYNCCSVWLRDGETGINTQFIYNASRASLENNTNYNVFPDYWSADPLVDLCLAITYSVFWVLYSGCSKGASNTMLARAQKTSFCLDDLTTNKTTWTSISNVQYNRSFEWLQNEDGNVMDLAFTCAEPPYCLPCKKVLDGDASIQGEYSFLEADTRCNDSCLYENDQGEPFCFQDDGENYVQQGCEPGLVWTTPPHTSTSTTTN